MFEKLEELAKNNKKISDFHIRSGSPLAYRQTGEIIKVSKIKNAQGVERRYAIRLKIKLGKKIKSIQIIMAYFTNNLIY